MAGAYIVIEGTDERVKETIIQHVAARLRGLERDVFELNKKSIKSTSAQAISQVLRTRRRALSPESRLLLRGAQLNETMRALKPGMQQGTIYLAPKGYVDFLVRSYYDGTSPPEYQAVNGIVGYAVQRTTPTLTILVDIATDAAAFKTEQDAERNERLRAGFLWEAKQRELPVVYSSGELESTYDQVWRHIATALHLEKAADSEPTAVADVLAGSPVAQLLETTTPKPAVAPEASLAMPYYVPTYLPDNLQCDYCDEVDRLMSAHRGLVQKLAEYLQRSQTLPAKEAAEQAVQTLASTIPVAVAGKEFVTALSHVQSTSDDRLSEIGTAHYGNRTDSVHLAQYHPHNELDLVPEMLKNPDKDTQPQLHFERWSYEAKTKALVEYMESPSSKNALSTAHYDWELFTETTTLVRLAEQVPGFERWVELDTLTPRYGYETPALVEEAGLSDAYDAIFDLSLQSQSTLQGAGYPQEAQFVTLLGHKQPWRLSIPGDAQLNLIQQSDTPLARTMREQVAEKHPLLIENVRAIVDNTTQPA